MSALRPLVAAIVIGALAAAVLVTAELADFAGRRYLLGAGVVALQVAASSFTARPAARARHARR